MSRYRPDRAARAQRGFTLIEVLVSLLVFAFGILGLVGLQASAIRFSTDAQQRADATFLADQIIGRMLISDPATAATFAHNPGGTTACAPSGAASTNPTVLEWLDEVEAVLGASSTPDVQQIVFNAGASEVTVRLCWRNGGDASDAPARSLEVINRVQWQ